MKNKKKLTLTISITLILITIGIILIIVYNKGYIFNKEEKETSYMPLTYEICDDNSCIYLLGSIHIGDTRVTKFDKKLIKLYNKNKYLAVELDTNNVKMNLEDFIAPENESLDDLLSEELKTKLPSFLQNKGLLEYEQLKYFKIGYVANYLSLLSALDLGLVNSGVDEYFLNLAHSKNKEIIELETYEEQLSLILDYSNDFYINQINSIIENYNEGKEELKKLYEEYLKANKTELENIIKEEEIPNTDEEREYQNSMITLRNQKMTSKVEEFLKEDKEVFMIVGLAHVLGEEGIIKTLEDKNYKIKIIGE